MISLFKCGILAKSGVLVKTMLLLMDVVETKGAASLIVDTGDPRAGLIGGGAGEEPLSAGDDAAAAADAASRAEGAASSEGGGGTPRWRTREAEQSGTAEDGKSEGNGGGGKRPLAPIETGS